MAQWTAGSQQAAFHAFQIVRVGQKDSDFISVVLYYTFVNGGMMTETQNKAILKEGTRYIRDYYKSLFEDVMKEVQSGRADYGVLPAENSSTGIITQVYDLLNLYDVYIIAKYVVRVKHALLGIPGTELSDIRRVYSHPQGLLQCGSFLSEHADWEQISMKNTAVSARKVLEDRDKEQAAICSPKAAKIYGLQILKESISDNDNNSTIFLILGNKKCFEKDANEISITFTLSHETGSLYQILGFINNNTITFYWSNK